MNVINLATKRAQTQKYKGITLDQAHEVFRLNALAVQAIADKMRIDYKIVVGVLSGKIWPQAHQQWVY